MKERVNIMSLADKTEDQNILMQLELTSHVPVLTEFLLQHSCGIPLLVKLKLLEVIIPPCMSFFADSVFSVPGGGHLAFFIAGV